jgi:hypothetical protein
LIMEARPLLSTAMAARALEAFSRVFLSSDLVVREVSTGTAPTFVTPLAE